MHRGVKKKGHCVPARPMTVLSERDVEGLQWTLEWVTSELANEGF